MMHVLSNVRYSAGIASEAAKAGEGGWVGEARSASI